MRNAPFRLLVCATVVGLFGLQQAGADLFPGDPNRPDISDADPAAIQVLAVDQSRVVRHGDWHEGGGGSDRMARNRYAWPMHLRTDEAGAKLVLEFEGTGVAVVFHTPRTPAFGPPWRDALLRATVNERPPVEIRHNEEPLEVVVADGLPAGRHRLVLEHVENGCTLLGFRVFNEAVGHLAAVVEGDNPQHLFDVRITAWRNGELIRTALHRNWLCGRVAVTGLLPGEGYRVRIDAIGWLPWERDGIRVRAGESLDLGRIHLQQDPATARGSVQWPALGYQAVRVPGETFEVQIEVDDWQQARLVRRSGPAFISRSADIRGQAVTIPDEMPPGVYDLHLISDGREPVVSPRSVVVRSRHAAGNLTVVGWGHTDTWGQLQAEFECALAAAANVIGPDVVLVSNSVNAAHIAGAMAGLEVPYLINFGNHRLPGHEAWYGSQVGLLDLGPEFVAFNFGHPWTEETSSLESLMASRGRVRGRLLNAYESDASADLLNRHRVQLLHYAHGRSGPRDGLIDGTQTMRVGKQTASSFRIVRIENHRIASVIDPLEVRRIGDPAVQWVPDPPVRIIHEQKEDATAAATVVNELPIDLPEARVVFVVPPGDYETGEGRIESVIADDDGRWVELVVRVNVAAGTSVPVSVRPRTEQLPD